VARLKSICEHKFKYTEDEPEVLLVESIFLFAVILTCECKWSQRFISELTLQVENTVDEYSRRAEFSEAVIILGKYRVL